MDGMVSNGDFKTKCCNAKTKFYRAKDYPYDSGWACTKCRNRWSELEIFRSQHLKKKINSGE